MGEQRSPGFEIGMPARSPASVPLISVVVPSYNQCQFLAETLTSIFAQADVNLEVIVVDGGSTDGSVDLIKRHASQLAWWVSEPDRGQSHALNKGFAKATGDWLTWLNSDDLFLAGALLTLREKIEREPEKQWWIGGGRFIDERGRVLRHYRAPAGLVHPSQLSDWRTHWFAQPGTFFSRRLFAEAGGQVREDLRYAMDLELWLRFLAKSSPGFIDSELSAYRLHAAAKTTVLTPDCELEIVRVLTEQLGGKAALDRVALIARERMEFEQKYRRLERLLQPLIRVYSPAKRFVKTLFKSAP
jgi:glycosyltransferase involved in cell wall biosynthesis